MLGYVRDALQKLQHVIEKYPQYSPHPYYHTNWTKKGERQSATAPDTSPLLLPEKIKYIQQVVGTFLYYARALDNTMLTALNDIGSQQALPTLNVQKKVQQLLDYANTYPDVFIRFYASDMQLHFDTDAAFLVLPNARSRIAGYFYLLHYKESPKFNLDNGPIYILCKTLRSVVTSAVFHSAKESIPVVHILTQMGHTQRQPTPLKSDNSTAVGFVNKNMQMKQSKTWDMHLHWLRDKQNTDYFKVFLLDKTASNSIP